MAAIVTNTNDMNVEPNEYKAIDVSCGPQSTFVVGV